MTWRTGRHYGIHVYDGDRPVATFHRAEDARLAVEAVNAMRPMPVKEFVALMRRITEERDRP